MEFTTILLLLISTTLAELSDDCPRELVQEVDPECQDRFEVCTNEAGGPLDCQEVCHNYFKTLEVPAIFDSCDIDHCKSTLAGCIAVNCPFKVVNTCEKPHLNAINVVNKQICTNTINFRHLDICKASLQCNVGEDLRACADRSQIPECAYTLENYCTDAISYIKEEPSPSRCREVRRPVCRNNAVNQCRQQHPECFNRKCGIKMLRREEEIEDCKQSCHSGLRCESVIAPNCIYTVRRNVCQ